MIAKNKINFIHLSSKTLRLVLLIIIAIPLFLISCKAQSGKSGIPEEKKYVLIVSMDGFRYDYPQRFDTPNLDYIAETGVFSDSLVPVFPSSTFPNHYSMATGLYPDNHGIVANNFYCAEIDRSFFIRDRDAIENGAFYAGEPIWNTAQKQGIKTATYYWVGSEAEIDGMQPDYWKKYDGSVSFENRIDSVIYWFSLPETKRPQLVMLYFDEPDHTGHRLGPDNDAMAVTIEYLDSLTGVLHSKLKKLDIYENLNFIVTSDHGMAHTDVSRHINLMDYIQGDWIERRHGGSPVYIIEPKPEFADTVYSIISGIDNLSIWKNDELPERFNYGNNPRTLSMTIAADIGWSVGVREYNNRYIGSHGYDNKYREMHTVFYATGPDFKTGHKHSKFMVIDLYPLLVKLLGIKPAKVDGDFDRVKGMLKE